MRYDPANRAQMMPSWAFSFARWAATSYVLGILMFRIGLHRNLPWMLTVGRMVAFIGGAVLGGLYAVAIVNYGKRT